MKKIGKGTSSEEGVRDHSPQTEAPLPSMPFRAILHAKRLRTPLMIPGTIGGGQLVVDGCGVQQQRRTICIVKVSNCIAKAIYSFKRTLESQLIAIIQLSVAQIHTHSSPGILLLLARHPSLRVLYPIQCRRGRKCNCSLCSGVWWGDVPQWIGKAMKDQIVSSIN